MKKIKSKRLMEYYTGYTILWHNIMSIWRIYFWEHYCFHVTVFRALICDFTQWAATCRTKSSNRLWGQITSHYLANTRDNITHRCSHTQKHTHTYLHSLMHKHCNMNKEMATHQAKNKYMQLNSKSYIWKTKYTHFPSAIK